MPAPVTTARPAGRWARVAWRTTVTWLAGLSGAVASIRGWGGIVMYPPVQTRGILVLGAVTLAALVVVQLLEGRLRGAPLLVTAAAYAAALPMTAPNVGRAPAIVAVTSVAAARAVFVSWDPVGSRPVRSHRVVLAALVPFAAAQCIWVVVDSIVATLVALIATFGVCEVAHRRPSSTVDTSRRIPGAMRRGAVRLRRSAVSSLGSLEIPRRARAVRHSAGSLLTNGAERARRVAELRTRVPTPPRTTAITAAAGVIVGAVYAPVLWLLTNNNPGTRIVGINDFDLHIFAARRFSLVPLNLEVPHFLFHAASTLTTAGFGDEAGPVITLVVAMALSGAAVQLLFGRPTHSGEALSPARSAMGAVLFFAMETPTVVLMWLGVAAPTTLFMTLHATYSPTWIVAVPFTFLTLVFIDRLLDPPAVEGAGRADRFLLAGSVILAALAKPGLVLVLIPGLPVYLLLDRTARPAAKTLLMWAAAPAAAVVAWQVLFMRGSDTELGSNSFTFDPISGPSFGWSRTGWLFWLPFVWILLAVWVSRGGFLREPLVRLVSSCLAFAVALFLLFRESGPRAEHSNLGVPAQACVTVLVALSLRSVAVASQGALRRRRLEQGRLPWWLPVAAGTTLAFAAGGLLSFLDAVGLTRIPIDWTAFP